MKTAKAMKIIKAAEKPISKRASNNVGFMVHFDVHERSVFAGDYFPDKHAGEKLIKTEEEAWRMAKRFANATGREVGNIYVVDHEHRPVAGYNAMKLKRFY